MSNRIDVYKAFKDRIEYISENFGYVEEFFKFKKGKVKKYDGEYGSPISEKEKDDIVEVYEKSVEGLTRLIKSSLPGCKMLNVEQTKSTKKYDGVIVYDIHKPLISIKDNWKIFQSKFKNEPDISESSFDDADGEALYECIEKLILKNLDLLNLTIVIIFMKIKNMNR